MEKDKEKAAAKDTEKVVGEAEGKVSGQPTKKKKGRLSYRPAMKLSTLATAGIACAGFALLFKLLGWPGMALLFAIPATVLGVLSVQFIRGSHGALTGQGMAYVGAALGVIIALTSLSGAFNSSGGGVVGGGGNRGSEKIRMKCREHVKQLHAGLVEYRNRNKGEMPFYLAVLYPEYVNDIGAFHCPGDTDAVPKSINMMTAGVSYSYFFQNSKHGRANYLILQDNSPENHASTGMHQAYMTAKKGFVSWVQMRERRR